MKYGFLYRLLFSVKREETKKEKLNRVIKNASDMFLAWGIKKKPIRFFIGLSNYIRLAKSGFYISRSSGSHFRYEMYRFFWKEKTIKDMADIDCVDGLWNTMKDGHVENLSKPE